MSLAAADTYAESSDRDGPVPPRRDDARKAEVAAAASLRQNAVLSHVPARAGISLSDLTEAVVRDLGIGWRSGTGAVVRELLDAGALVSRESVLYRASHPRGPSPEEWGAWCRETRLARKWNQNRLGQVIGRSAATISALESGRGSEPGLRSAVEAVLGRYGAEAAPSAAPTTGVVTGQPATAGSTPSCLVADRTVDEDLEPRSPAAAEVVTGGGVETPAVPSEKEDEHHALTQHEVLALAAQQPAGEATVVGDVRPPSESPSPEGQPSAAPGLASAHPPSSVPDRAEASPLPGVKTDTGKARWDLLPWREVGEVVGVLTFGLSKYQPDNWQRVSGARARYFAAAQRHLTLWWLGEARDPESGLSHLGHAACCLLFLMWFDNEGGAK